MKHPLKFLILILLLCIAAGQPMVEGALLTLSTHLSEPLVDPGLLDASLDFSVVGSELTLAVNNLTPENPGDPALNINQVYFNTSDNVDGLVLSTVNGGPASKKWKLIYKVDSHEVANFGSFDVFLEDGIGNQPSVIGPQETVTFTFNISGTGPFSDADFIQLSATDGGEHVFSFAAAKFYDGGNPGISSYAATNIPEPVTLMLLGLGGLGLLCRRKRA